MNKLMLILLLCMAMPAAAHHAQGMHTYRVTLQNVGGSYGQVRVIISARTQSEAQAIAHATYGKKHVVAIVHQ